MGLSVFVNLLYPPACLLCGSRQPQACQTVCEACRAALPAGGPGVCAPWLYADAAVRAVHAIQRRPRPRLTRWIAGEMASLARSRFPADRIDAVAAVPAHFLNRWLRGHSAAESLARAVAAELRLPLVPGALRQIRWRRSQAGLSRARRLLNVRGTVDASAALVRGRRWLLVDDVLTTGATATACAEALAQAGAGEVFVLTAARTPQP